MPPSRFVPPDELPYERSGDPDAPGDFDEPGELDDPDPNVPRDDPLDDPLDEALFPLSVNEFPCEAFFSDEEAPSPCDELPRSRWGLLGLLLLPLAGLFF